MLWLAIVSGALGTASIGFIIGFLITRYRLRRWPFRIK
jgi:ABC-type branched-subunit amino acid transport system permease subunit